MCGVTLDRKAFPHIATTSSIVIAQWPFGCEPARQAARPTADWGCRKWLEGDLHGQDSWIVNVSVDAQCGRICKYKMPEGRQPMPVVFEDRYIAAIARRHNLTSLRKREDFQRPGGSVFNRC